MSPETSWKALKSHADTIRDERMDDWFRIDSSRADRYRAEAAGLCLDYSRNRITDQTLNLLWNLGETCGLSRGVQAMFRGEAINTTEGRAVLHTALRDQGQRVGGKIAAEIGAGRRQMETFVQAIHDGRWTGTGGEPIETVINIGIGGSDLGPAMVHGALAPYRREKPVVRHLSNLDGTAFRQAVRNLNPATSLFVVASKSFSTQETHRNALSARAWCLEHGISESELRRHFVAVTSNIPAAVEFGIAEENIFPLWDFVGGRFSLWSAIGLPIALGLGMDAYQELLAGAHDMDEHFLHAPVPQNLPVILGMLGIWNLNLLGFAGLAVIPYDHNLSRFPAYLQQLEMESNGKSVTLSGEPVSVDTGPILFGEPGTNCQHSFFQLLHQGTRTIPVDFILPARSHHPVADHHSLLVANCLGQARALMSGRTLEEIEARMREQGSSPEQIERLAPHRVIPGNKPSNLIMMKQLTPASLGALIALYEHKVVVQSLIWRINAFDQWGVELGKEYSHSISRSLQNVGSSDLDPATTASLAYLHSLATTT